MERATTFHLFKIRCDKMHELYELHLESIEIVSGQILCGQLPQVFVVVQYYLLYHSMNKLLVMDIKQSSGLKKFLRKMD